MHLEQLEVAARVQHAGRTPDKLMLCYQFLFVAVLVFTLSLQSKMLDFQD